MHITLISLALSLLVVSCYRVDPWRNVTIKAGHTDYDSTRLIYPATNFSHDIEIEFLYTLDTLHAYINVYSQPIPPYQEDDKVAILSFDTKEHHHELPVFRLSGGQRLKIPEESLELFVELLEKNPYVLMTLKEGYRTKINTKNFKNHFNHLKTKPFPFIPNDPIGLAL